MTKTAIIKQLSSYETKEVLWLWPGRFQQGKLGIIVGDPGQGKSFLTLDMAARISKGIPWPTGDECVQGSVLFITGEDDPSDTIKPRLEVMGGDPEKVFILEGVNTNGREKPIHIKDDIKVIEALVEEHASKVVIIDPLLAYMSGIDAYKYTDVYDTLLPLNLMCARMGVTVIGVMHMNKNVMMDFAYRAVGSVAFLGACRSMHMIRVEKKAVANTDAYEDTGRKFFSPIKMSNKDKQPDLAFRIVTTTHPTLGFEIGKVEWEGAVGVSNMEEVLDEEERTKLNAAKMMIGRWLEDGGGQAPAKNIEEEAKRLGIGKTTLERAKKEIGVVSELRHGSWWWRGKE